MIEDCKNTFLSQLYPTLPILDRAQIRDLTAEMYHSEETYCLILALCAFVLIQPQVETVAVYAPSLTAFAEATTVRAQYFLSEALTVRKNFHFRYLGESPTINGVITSFFIFGCFFGLNRQAKAWHYLREATAWAQILGMQNELFYQHEDGREALRRRRLFWLLVVTERQVGHMRCGSTDLILMLNT